MEEKSFKSIQSSEETNTEEKQKNKEELIQLIQKTKRKRQQVLRQNQQLKHLTDGWIQRYNQILIDQSYAMEQLEASERIKKSLQTSYDKLSVIDVLSDMIFISHRGFYATINGLRLALCTSDPAATINTTAVHDGTLGEHSHHPQTPTGATASNSTTTSSSNNQVPFHEMNAAIGFIALLIHILQHELHMTHKTKFIIIPRGSYTKISSRKTNQQWDLFYQPVTFQFFARRNWNAAINILAYCVLEVAMEIKSYIPTFHLPFSMEVGANTFEGDRMIGTVKVEQTELSYQGDNAAAWTTNMRWIAANLKIMQAMVLDIRSSSGTRG